MIIHCFTQKLTMALFGLDPMERSYPTKLLIGAGIQEVPTEKTWA
jgi:hypothetical protein